MNTLLTIIKLLPAIIEAVRAAEQFVPISGAGKAKLDFVLGLVQDTTDAAVEIMPTVTKVVGRVVELANATGAFQKGGK